MTSLFLLPFETVYVEAICHHSAIQLDLIGPYLKRFKSLQPIANTSVIRAFIKKLI